MKKQILKTIFSLLTLLSILSCSNSDSNGDSNQYLSQVPLAKSQYDNSNFGIYKGVFIGSSGTIILDLSNSTNSFTATLIIDGSGKSNIQIPTFPLLLLKDIIHIFSCYNKRYASFFSSLSYLVEIHSGDILCC